MCCLPIGEGHRCFDENVDAGKQPAAFGSRQVTWHCSKVKDVVVLPV